MPVKPRNEQLRLQDTIIASVQSACDGLGLLNISFPGATAVGQWWYRLLLQRRKPRARGAK